MNSESWASWCPDATFPKCDQPQGRQTDFILPQPTIKHIPLLTSSLAQPSSAQWIVWRLEMGGGGAETNPPQLIKPSGLQAGSFLWKRFTLGGEFTKLCPRFCMLYTPNPLLYAAYFSLAFGSIVLASSKFCLCFFTLINWEGVLTTGHVWCVVPD